MNEHQHEAEPTELEIAITNHLNRLIDIGNAVNDAIDHLHAIRRSDHYLAAKDRYSFTNEADADECELLLLCLKNIASLAERAS